MPGPIEEAQRALARLAVEILTAHDGYINLYPESDDPNRLRTCATMYAAAAQGLVRIDRERAGAGDDAEWWQAELVRKDG